MTLLKILYFAHAWHLAKFDSPLVGQPFEAWKHGPVSRVVYEQLKGLGSKPITAKLKSFSANEAKYVDTPYEFDPETRRLLENVYDYYALYHPFTLSDLTHEKGSPWESIWGEAEKGAVPGMVIPDQLIKEWFREEKAMPGDQGKRYERPHSSHTRSRPS
jgi:uncharacterized phage-associated protein